jgi:hypothetical protein
MKASRLVLLGFIVLLSTGLLAEEGMWMPQQIPALAAKLRALGFTGDPKAFADLTGQPMGAIVSLGGCTASFVSPDGLVVTNHHCVTGGLQFNSTPDRNLLEDGFFAPTLSDELPNGPGSRVFVTTSAVDVTTDIIGGIDAAAAERERYDTIDRRVKERIAACEKDGSRCSVVSFFEGLKYFEIKQLEIKDVRLVYAPAEGIGVFGGETDNWRWPRHTGDWSYLRAYVGRDGKTAAYDRNNVPYKPAHWLKVAKAGVKPNDLVFVVGYPGRTQRHQTYAEVKETVEWALPRSIRLAEEQLALIDTLTKQNPALAIKLAGRVQGLNNGLTNSRGVLEGMVKGGALARKHAREQELLAWIAASPARQERYGQALSAIQAFQAKGEATRDRRAALGLLASASSYLGSAQTLYRSSVQRTKDDVSREPGFQERDWPRIREAQDRLQRTIDPVADKALLRWAIGKAAALPAGQRLDALDRAAGLKPGMDQAAAEAAIDAYLIGLYAGTKLADRDVRLAYLGKSTAELMASGDTFIALAAALEPMAEANRETVKEQVGYYTRIRPVYMEALLEKAGGLLAPDANSTLRVTYGQVKGVDTRDGLFYKPQTTLQGIVEKHTGSGDFDAPQKQLDAVKALRAGKTTVFFDKGVNDVPVNFLSTVDTTGGNSGSPTLNAKGELVGLLFDGTYESVSSDYLFDSVKTRSIHVDSRYMLWTMAEVDGAKRLLDEMGVSLTAPAAARVPAKASVPARVPAAVAR